MQNNVDNELSRFPSWSLTDLRKLVKGLEAIIHQRESEQPLYDIRKFRGIGQGIWIDEGGVDEFIEQERASWDG